MSKPGHEYTCGDSEYNFCKHPSHWKDMSPLAQRLFIEAEGPLDPDGIIWCGWEHWEALADAKRGSDQHT